MQPIEALNAYWGYKQFRPLQEEIIYSILHRHDTLALLPTGGGKSLCYQVPAMCMEGVAIVISPLIALMNDQIESLKHKGIKAVALTSQLSKREWLHVLESCTEMDIKLIYISPERLQNPLLQDKIKQIHISFIAVDEAHCISQWGHDFRPAYRHIAALRKLLPPDVPCLALTATATPEVISDIISNLHFRPNHKIYKKSFDRPNLSYSIRIVENKIDKLLQSLRAISGSAIVFIRYRIKTTQLVTILTAHGISADFYHAGLTAEDRKEKQQRWMQGHTRVMVATNAFGMGIDKPDVRLVIHLNTVPSIEEYFQEAGRAGRDGDIAYAVSFISPADLARLKDDSYLWFPSPQEISNAYQSLFEYLRIPVNSGQFEKHPFSIQKFAQYIQQPKLRCYEILRWLEREGHIALDDQILRQSKLRFYFDYYDLCDRYPHDTPLIDIVQTILRIYEGVRHTLVDIDESKIASLAESKDSTVRKVLYHLSRTGDADYYPKDTDGFLTILRPRIDRSSFTIDQYDYQIRKSRHIARWKATSEFYHLTDQCRVIYLLRYLGENKTEPCGRCDYCRDQLQIARNTTSREDQLREASEKEIIKRNDFGTLQSKKSN